MSVFLGTILLVETAIKFGLIFYNYFAERSEFHVSLNLFVLKCVLVVVGGLDDHVTVCGTDALPSWHLTILGW